MALLHERVEEGLWFVIMINKFIRVHSSCNIKIESKKKLDPTYCNGILENLFYYEFNKLNFSKEHFFSFRFFRSSKQNK